MWQETVITSDVLIIGGGIAGCMAAMAARAAGVSVTVVDKGYAGSSGASIHPDIGMVVFRPEWGGEYQTCLRAMGEAGGWISNRPWCEAILQESGEIYQDMLDWGIEFPQEDARYRMYFPPIPHVRLKHRKLAPGLRRQAQRNGAQFYDRVEMIDLLKKDGRIVGAMGFSLDEEILYQFYAKATILSAGSNSFRAGGENCGITGDSDAMAYRAGAQIMGKEFGSSTFPTMARYPTWSRTAHGMVNPAYAVFTDGAGQRLDAVHDSDSIENEWGLKVEHAIHAGRGPIYWDTTAATDEQLEFIRAWRRDTHNPVEYQWADRYLDLCRRGRFELAGGYAVGFSSVGCTGARVVGLDGRTTLEGLFAAGDAGGTLHNGCYNMCPGLGTAGAAVTGRHAGLGAAAYCQGRPLQTADLEQVDQVRQRAERIRSRSSGFTYTYITRQVRNIMTPYYVSLIKDGPRLNAALEMVRFLRRHLVPKLFARDLHELRMALEAENMVLNAEMMLRASLARTESRGVHFREDYPAPDEQNWRAWTAVSREGESMRVEKIPVPAGMWDDV